MAAWLSAIGGAVNRFFDPSLQAGYASGPAPSFELANPALRETQTVKAIPAPTPVPVRPAEPPPSDRQAQDNARAAINGGVDNYHAPSPPITVDDPDVKEIVNKAVADAKTARTGIDQAAMDIKTTLSLMDAAEKPGSGTTPEYRSYLRTRLTQQQDAAKTAQGKYDTANATAAAANVVLHNEQAQEDFPVAQASQKAADQAYVELGNALPRDGAVKSPDKGSVLSGSDIAKLTPDQQVAYGRYSQAQNVANRDAAKVNADMANANQNYAQLQLYASDPGKYGSAAQDAVVALNQALAASGMRMKMPDRIDPADAQRQLDEAINGSIDPNPDTRAQNPGATQANAALEAAAAIVQYQGVSQPVSDAQIEVTRAENALKLAGNDTLVTYSQQQLQTAKSNLQAQQARNKTAIASAGIDLNTRLDFYYQVLGNKNVTLAQNSYNAAKAKYDAFIKDHPETVSVGNSSILKEGGTQPLPVGIGSPAMLQAQDLAKAMKAAQGDLDFARQQAATYQADFKSAYAQSYLQQVKGKFDQAAQATRVQGPFSSEVLNKRQSDLKTAQANYLGAKEVADQLGADAAKSDAMLNVSLLERKADGLQQQIDTLQAQVKSGNADPTALTQAQTSLSAIRTVDLPAARNALKAAQKDVLMTQFQNGLPDSLKKLIVNPDGTPNKDGFKSAGDDQKKAYSDAFDAFAKQHTDEIVLGTIAQEQAAFHNGEQMTWGTGDDQIDGGNQFRNIVGRAIGAEPHVVSDAHGNPDPQADWYAGNADVDKVVAALKQTGGAHPAISIETSVDSQGMQTVNLIKVPDKDGKTFYVDHKGDKYDSKANFLQQNDLDDRGKLYTVDGRNADGTFKYQVGSAHDTTFWQGMQKVGEFALAAGEAALKDPSTWIALGSFAVMEIAGVVLDATVVGAPAGAALNVAGAVELAAVTGEVVAAAETATEAVAVTNAAIETANLAATATRTVQVARAANIAGKAVFDGTFVAMGAHAALKEAELVMDKGWDGLFSVESAGNILGVVGALGGVGGLMGKFTKIFEEAGPATRVLDATAGISKETKFAQSARWEQLAPKLETYAKRAGLAGMIGFGGQMGMSTLQAIYAGLHGNWEEVGQILGAQAPLALFLGQGAISRGIAHWRYGGDTGVSIPDYGHAGRTRLSADNAGVWGNRPANNPLSTFEDPLNGTLWINAGKEAPMAPLLIEGSGVKPQADGTLEVNGKILMVDGEPVMLDGDTFTFAKEKTADANGNEVTRDTICFLGEKVAIARDGSLRLGDQMEKVAVSTGGELLIGGKAHGNGAPMSVPVNSTAPAGGNSTNGSNTTAVPTASSVIDAHAETAALHESESGGKDSVIETGSKTRREVVLEIQAHPDEEPRTVKVAIELGQNNVDVFHAMNADGDTLAFPTRDQLEARYPETDSDVELIMQMIEDSTGQTVQLVTANGMSITMPAHGMSTHSLQKFGEVIEGKGNPGPGVVRPNEQRIDEPPPEVTPGILPSTGNAQRNHLTEKQPMPGKTVPSTEDSSFQTEELLPGQDGTAMHEAIETRPPGRLGRAPDKGKPRQASGTGGNETAEYVEANRIVKNAKTTGIGKTVQAGEQEDGGRLAGKQDDEAGTGRRTAGSETLEEKKQPLDTDGAGHLKAEEIDAQGDSSGHPSQSQESPVESLTEQREEEPAQARTSDENEGLTQATEESHFLLDSLDDYVRWHRRLEEKSADEKAMLGDDADYAFDMLAYLENEGTASRPKTDDPRLQALGEAIEEAARADDGSLRTDVLEALRKRIADTEFATLDATGSESSSAVSHEGGNEEEGTASVTVLIYGALSRKEWLRLLNGGKLKKGTYTSGEKQLAQLRANRKKDGVVVEFKSGKDAEQTVSAFNLDQVSSVSDQDGVIVYEADGDVRGTATRQPSPRVTALTGSALPPEVRHAQPMIDVHYQGTREMASELRSLDRAGHENAALAWLNFLSAPKPVGDETALREWHLLPEADRRRIVPSIGNAFREGSEEALAHALIKFPDAYPLLGEVDGLGGNGHIADPQAEQFLQMAQRWGVVTVVHRNWGETELGLDGEPVVAPGDGRYFFPLMNALMRHGAYEVTEEHLEDGALTPEALQEILAKGPVREPANIILSHLGVGDTARMSPVYLDMLEWALAHPLLTHVMFDLSSAHVHRPIADDVALAQRLAMLMSRYPVRFVYGSAGIDAENFTLPWRRTQAMLQEVNRISPEALRRYASGNIESMMENARPRIDQARYETIVSRQYDGFIASLGTQEQAAIRDWADAYALSHSSVGTEALAAQAGHGTYPSDSGMDAALSVALYQMVHGEISYDALSRVMAFDASDRLVSPPRATVVRQAGAPPATEVIEQYMHSAPLREKELAALRDPDGERFSAAALEAASQAAKAGADRGLQLAVLAASQYVEMRQRLRDSQVSDAQQSRRKIMAGLSLSMAALTAACVAAVPLANADAHALGFAVRGVLALAIVAHLHKVGKTFKTVSGKELPTQKMVDSIEKTATGVARQYGLPEARLEHVRQILGQYRVDLEYQRSQPIDKANGDSRQARNIQMQDEFARMMASLEDELGQKLSGLKQTDPRAMRGFLFETIKIATYLANEIYVIHDGIAHPGNLLPWELGFILTNPAYIFYSLAGVVSTRFKSPVRQNWQEKPFMQRIANYVAGPTLIWGELGWAIVDWNMHHSIPMMLVDAAFAAAVSFTWSIDVGLVRRLAQRWPAARKLEHPAVYPTATALLGAAFIAYEAAYFYAQFFGGQNGGQGPALASWLPGVSPAGTAPGLASPLPVMPQLTANDARKDQPEVEARLNVPEAPAYLRKTVTVREGASLWSIAVNNEDTLLSARQKERLASEHASEEERIRAALADLIELNPERHFDLRLMDGKATAASGDPDSIQAGWRLAVGG
jgi:hypothetical protein